MNQYKEYLPSKALSRYIDCFWTTKTVENQKYSARIIPDGCVDIIFDLKTKNSEKTIVVGAMSKPEIFETNTAIDMLGIRFAPGSAFHFLGVPLIEFKDKHIQLEDIIPRCEVQKLHEGFNTAVSIKDRLSFLENHLAISLERIVLPSDRIIEAINHLCLPGIQESVEEISNSLGITRQHLRRLFDKYVGLNPKEFFRIIRAKNLADTIKQSSKQLNWIDAALEFGYYDQSHMVNEFKSLIGVCPSNFSKNL